MSDAELEKIAAEVRVCKMCPLWKSRTNAVPGAGPAEAKIMVIGEAPGRKEDQLGLPFVGAAGRNLEQMLSHAGFGREEVFITNIVKCRPPSNRRPSRRVADTCYQYLRRQMEKVDPEVVVLLGDVALKQFFPEANLKSSHGKSLKRKGRTFFPTYHPAAMIYNPSLRELVSKDFGVLGTLKGRKKITA